MEAQCPLMDRVAARELKEMRDDCSVPLCGLTTVL